MLSERGLFLGESIPKIIGAAEAGVDAGMLHRRHAAAKGLRCPGGPTPSTARAESRG